MTKWVAIAALVFALSGCGSKSGPTIAITITPETALTDPDTADLILYFSYGSPPQYLIYPAGCCSDCQTTETVPANCGLSLAAPATLEIGNLPMGPMYLVEAYVRSSFPEVLYKGTISFTNDGKTTSLEIPVVAQ